MKQDVSTNHLTNESSPYLRQHASNPVHWYPWGPPAFERAKQLKRPILLSVGYSTCHWCHVMAHESFEDKEIAEVLNAHYVAIKVDREERPDVDAIYMSAVQAMSGHGGWPMTVWLTPEGTPFFAGTYFPARDGDRGARYGFLTLLKEIAIRYHENPVQFHNTGQEVARVIQQHMRPLCGAVPDRAVLDEAMAYYKARYDERFGGVKPAPKFPSGLPVRFLLQQHRSLGDTSALDMALHTLRQMAQGGMYDHVAGGFHRYSTDERWLVPHFEKMLYDNALLVLSYLDAFQATGDAGFATVVNETLAYIQREMTAPEGGFYSATDADSLTPDGTHDEGWYFTWTPKELHDVLGHAQGDLVAHYYGVTSDGNFEGRTVLHVTQSMEQLAHALGQSAEQVQNELEDAKALLRQARNQRPTPSLDDKILLAWNGLMIQAFARAARILGDATYQASAIAAAEFVLSHMAQEGRLLRSYCHTQARHSAYLDDYAFLIAGLLELFELTSDPRWLEHAMSLDQVLERHYEDTKDGGFFMTSHDHEVLIAREKPAYDGAEPSGNSMHAMNLLRLHALTLNDRYRKRLFATLQAFGPRLQTAPMAMSEMLLVLDAYQRGSKEVVIVTSRTHQEADAFMRVWQRCFAPQTMMLVITESELTKLKDLVPWLEGKQAIEGKPTAYVCTLGACKLPTTDPSLFAAQITHGYPHSG